MIYLYQYFAPELKPERADHYILNYSYSKKNRHFRSEAYFKDYRNLNDTTIRKHAENAGLDMAQFDKDYKDPAFEKIINSDYQVGRNAKVRGVPAIYVNGKPAKRARSTAASV